MPDIISGTRIVAVAVTEPGAGSDVKNIRTTARRKGNEYVLNGTKMFVTNGVDADLYCVAAKTALETRPSQSISMFLVEKDSPGFRVGKKLEKHGWLSSDRRHKEPVHRHALGKVLARPNGSVNCYIYYHWGVHSGRCIFHCFPQRWLGTVTVSESEVVTVLI